MRLFVGIEMSDEARAAAATAMDALRPHLPGARWVPPENLHVTLSFLGRSDRLDDVTAAVDAAAAPHAPFDVSLGGIGGFPTERRPRVVWIGLSGDLDALRSLAASVAGGLARIGFPPDDRPFAAHLTIARVNQPRAATLPPVRVEPVGTWVRAVTVFESRLGRPAPVYLPAHRAALAG